MDTLKGILYVEECNNVGNTCLAVEDPKDPEKTIIFTCLDQEVREYKKPNKRGGVWKFKAYKFNGRIKKIETIKCSLVRIWHDLPEDCFRQFPISELRKLEGWID